MDNNYQLINSVDPSKCRAKIREKFAKLTMSSNKKKQADAEMEQKIRERAALSNVSRNLMNSLLTDDESDNEKTEEKQATENLLMRTDSSPSDNNGAGRKSSLPSMNTTHCTEAEESMEPLHVSETDNTQTQQNAENVIETLSARVSMLTVEGPMTISSEGSAWNVDQKMDAGRRELQTSLRSEPMGNEVSICISSETEESVITIPDSAESEGELHVNMTPSYTSLRNKNLDHVKEERMANFLRDVKKNYGLAVTPERDFEDCCRKIAIADTEPMSSASQSQSIGVAKRIATADTESMSPYEEFTVAERDEAVRNTSKGNLATADTEDMTRADETMMSSPRYEPVMKLGTELLDDSNKDSCGSVPDDSLTIAETSEEEEEKEREDSKEEEPQKALIESNSPSVSSKRSSTTSVQSSEQDSQIQINISAKINIQISINQQQLQESSSSQNTTSSPANDRSVRESLEDQLHCSAQKAQPQSPPALEDFPHSPPERDVSLELPEPDVKSPDDFERAERLLNELYGSSWKTPQVLRSLKKTTVKRNVPKASAKKSDPKPNPKDESTIEDFSIFRQNIGQHLDSTRLVESPSVFKTPRGIRRPRRPAKRSEVIHEEDPVEESVKTRGKSTACQKVLNIPDSDSESEEEKASPVIKTKNCRSVQKRVANIVDSDTESEEEHVATSRREGLISKNSQSARRRVANIIDSDTESEEGNAKASVTQVVKTKSGRSVQQRLTKVVDTDTESEGENASDGSNQSWKMSDKEDIENTPEPVKKPQRRRGKNNTTRSQNSNELVYLDLSKGEVEIQHDVSASPPANHDANFSRRLEELLSSCRAKEKPKIEPTSLNKPKRKLFTLNHNDDDENVMPVFDSPKEILRNRIEDDASVTLSGGPLPSKFEPFNKHLESVKMGKPIFKLHTPNSKREVTENICPTPKTPKSAQKASRVVGEICLTPKDTYGFLKSLDLCVGKSFCHPDALYYRDNYRSKKDELAQKLYEIYNRKCFNGELDVPLKWNKKLTNTAGRCMNKKRLGERSCAIELSEKVLTSADRLRCTLIHELCHAATWIFNGEGGHGACWKAWARKANQIFPELPKIGVCHQYDIEYKYTYKCTLCDAKSHAHSKSKKVENIRCSYCHGAIEVFLNKKDKEGNVIQTPVKEPAGFAKFVKEKYKEYKKPDLNHADVMRLLSSEFASMKVDARA